MHLQNTFNNFNRVNNLQRKNLIEWFHIVCDLICSARYDTAMRLITGHSGLLASFEIER